MTDRDDAIKRVMKSLARRNATEALPVTRSDGTSPVVVAMPGDLVSAVLGRIERMGGAANVIVAYPDKYQICAFTSREVAEIEDHDDSVTPHGAASIEMVVQWLLSKPSGRGRLTISPLNEPVRVQESAYAF